MLIQDMKKADVTISHVLLDFFNTNNETGSFSMGY